MRYDLIVIGSGPSGQKGAIAAAKLGKRVALIEQQPQQLGGVCLHTGTIPSKAFREAIMVLTGFRHREIYPESFERRRNITVEELHRLASQVVVHETNIVRHQLESNGIELYSGRARFAGPHDVDVLVVENGTTSEAARLAADRILIAVGTRPARPTHIPFDGDVIFDSEELLRLPRIPRSMVVIGGGVIGLEFAMMYAVLGCEITVIDGHERLLPFIDREIVDVLMEQGRSLGLEFRLKKKLQSIARLNDREAVVMLDDGRKVTAEAVLFAAGRYGNTDQLNLEAAGLSADEQGRLWCNEYQQTWAKHIYGAGDVVGFPSLASVSMEQGRRAVCHAFDQPFVGNKLMPYGLYTTPEVAMIGPTESQLRKEGTPYKVGMARFGETARGHLSGDLDGMLKLLFAPDSHQLLAVHCIGESACELIHIGQTVMSFSGTIDYLRDAVFNYPTMAECYKVAAFYGLNRLHSSEKSADDILAEILAQNGVSPDAFSLNDGGEPFGIPACVNGSSLVSAGS